MTAFMLLKSLCEFLEQSVEDYAAAQDTSGKFKVPRVFEWFLPFKNPRAPEKIDFPYIVARINEGEDRQISAQAQEGSIVQIDISFGLYNEGKNEDGFVHPDGSYDLLNLMEHVRIDLFKQRVIANRYEIIKPYKWTIPLEQPYPLWVGQATTLWTVSSVMSEKEAEFLHGG